MLINSQVPAAQRAPCVTKVAALPALLPVSLVRGQRSLPKRQTLQHQLQKYSPARNLLCRSLDYTATGADEGVLKLPARTDLQPEQITHVFGYPRNLSDKYQVGRVIGAGSFGVVRECISAKSGRKYAVKSIGKVPKRGMSTPRYLLKLRTEVEIMQQLGYSLDAVNLKVL